MATRQDPYTDKYGGQHNAEYHDEQVYNPYIGGTVPHQTYEQGNLDHGYEHDNYSGQYRDEPEPLQETREGPTNVQPAYGLPSLNQRPGAVRDESFVPPLGEKTPKSMRQYRLDNQGALWTKGSRGSCIGRFCCCTILITLFLIISVVLSLALWIRPPNVDISNPAPPKLGSTIQPTEEGINLNLGLNISVANPNYFSVKLSKIKATITYPVNNTDLGGGSAKDITFDSHSNSTFTFPFTISYKRALDPNNDILVDLATKCGVIGPGKSQISVKYKIDLGIQIFFVTVSPTISNTVKFDCPLRKDDLAGLLRAAGISL